MNSVNFSDSYETNGDICIKLSNGETIVDDDGYKCNDYYEPLIEVKYTYSGLFDIPYEQRVYSESYEESLEITDIILLVGFTWKGKHYDKGINLFDYPEFDDIINVDEFEFCVMERIENNW